jgi:formylglycine-generating enzyme required for sulfatase activity
MVFFPGDTFTMGIAGDPEAGPPHLVSLSAFYLDRHEVSRAAYHTFAQTRGQRLTFPDQPDLPASLVSWEEAAAYCQAQSKRLPTEAEWECAARGGEDRLYPWGHTAPTAQLVRFGGQSGEPAAVDAMPQGASPQGVYHLAGNVAEWVQDWWAPGYAVPAAPAPYTALPGVVSTLATRASAPAASGVVGSLPTPVADPLGPEAGDYKVVRGGSWTQPAEEVAATARAYHNPDKGAAYIGFRCARTALADTTWGQ